MKGFCILIRKYIPKVPIDNKSEFANVMVWHQTGDKPLPEVWFNSAADWMPLWT